MRLFPDRFRMAQVYTYPGTTHNLVCSYQNKRLLVLQHLSGLIFYADFSSLYIYFSTTFTSTAPVFLKNSIASSSFPDNDTSIKKWSSVVLTSGFSAFLNGHSLLLK